MISLFTIKIIISTKVGTMHGPMSEHEPPSTHVNVPSLLAILAFCFFAFGMTSPSTQALTNSRTFVYPTLTSCMKDFIPFAFYS